MRRYLAVGAAALSLSGCTTGPDGVNPARVVADALGGQGAITSIDRQKFRKRLTDICFADWPNDPTNRYYCLVEVDKRVAQMYPAVRPSYASDAPQSYVPTVPGPADVPGTGYPSAPLQAPSTVCSLTGSWVNELARNCAYNCAGSQVVQSIGASYACQATITLPSQ